MRAGHRWKCWGASFQGRVEHGYRPVRFGVANQERRWFAGVRDLASQMARLLMLRLVCLTLVFGIAPPAFAQGAPPSTPASCSALDSASGATVGNAITCMIDTVRPNGILVVIVSTFVPILLVIWGARGGFTLIATVVRRMFGFMTGRA